MMSQFLLGLTLALGQTGPGDNFAAPPFRGTAQGVFDPAVFQVLQEPEKMLPDLQPKNGNGNGKLNGQRPVGG